MRHTLLLSITVLAAALVSCTQDELADGNVLPDSQYPLTLTAGVAIEAQTCATADGTWDGDETIIVEITDDYRGSWPKQSNGTYTIDKGGNMTLKSGTQSYWQSSNEKKYIRAVRYGNDARALRPSWEVKSDQSNAEDYAEGDLLYAWHIVEKMENANLTFYHQTAKVVVNLVSSSFLTANEVSSLTIGDAGNQIVALSGKVTTNPSADDVVLTAITTDKSFIKPCEIIPTPTTYAKSYQALVIPQTFEAGQKLFVIKVDGYDTFYYTVPTDGITWKAGNEYTYDITVTPTGLEVTTDVSIGWTENNTPSSGSVTTYTDYKAVGSGTAEDPYQISNAVQLRNFVTAVNAQSEHQIKDCIKLMNDIDVSGMDWVPICGDANDENITKVFNGVFDGNGHTITGLSFSSSDRSLFAFVRNNSGTIKDLTIKDCNISYSYGSFGGEIAGFAEYNVGTIVNCHLVGGNIDIAYYAAPTAGIACSNNGKIIACSNSAAITAKDYAYGITFRNYGDIIACCNTGALSASNPNYDFGLGGICYENISDGKCTACYYIKVTESNKYSDIGTELTGDDWTDAVDAMNTALSNNGYSNYKWTWSGKAGEAPTVVINN